MRIRHDARIELDAHGGHNGQTHLRNRHDLQLAHIDADRHQRNDCGDAPDAAACVDRDRADREIHREDAAHQRDARQRIAQHPNTGRTDARPRWRAGAGDVIGANHSHFVLPPHRLHLAMFVRNLTGAEQVQLLAHRHRRGHRDRELGGRRQRITVVLKLPRPQEVEVLGRCHWQIGLCNRRDFHEALAFQRVRGKCEFRPVGGDDRTALRPEDRLVRHWSAHGDRHHKFHAAIDHGHIGIAAADSRERAIASHGDDGRVAREILGVRGDERSRVRIAHADLKLLLPNHRHERDGIRIDIEPGEELDLVEAVWFPDDKGGRRLEVAAIRAERANTLGETGQLAAVRKTGNTGIERCERDVRQRQLNVLLVCEVADQDRLEEPADGDLRTPLQESDMQQRCVTDVDLHGPLGGPVTVVGTERHRGAAREAAIRLDEDGTAVARETRTSAGCPEHLEVQRIPLCIRCEAEHRYRQLQALVREQRHRRGHERCLVRRIAEVGVKELSVSRIDAAIRVEVTSGQEARLANLRAAGYGEEIRIESVDTAVSVDVSGHEKR